MLPENRFKCPTWVNSQGKAWWKRNAPSLLHVGILHEGTFDLVASMAENFGIYLEANRHLREEGRVIESHTGARKVNPYVQVEKQAWEMYCRAFKELRIIGEPVKGSEDELEQFLNVEKGVETR